ncbi:MAG: type transport system ATP-binding protein [Gaiellales bacterium]|jgi:daunorubicin resistance ABC transporter ATP-binding subunit|nr:type transport system ATP-binding protein [Gaiellales bacterium]MDX6599119.1 type transport system ATP-binding protein [Gaiellales bacterium]
MTTSAQAVEVTDLAVSFGETRALDGVDLTVAAGTVQGLLGPNGAGKTTLVRVLATLLRPGAGSARVFGCDVVRDATRVRALIGLAGQFAAVDGTLTGRENLEMIGRLYRLSKAEAKRRAAESLERLGLADAADRVVRGYSGGMRRRLDLGASLVGRPRLLILDEPTTGLDPQSRNDVWAFIRELVEDGTTVLLTTQYLDEADKLADHIVVIDHGKVIAEGTPRELKARMGADVLELHVDDPDALESTAAALRGIGSGEPSIDYADRRITLPVHQGAADLMSAVRRLDELGIVPSDLSLRRPSLDDVFLALTGRGATPDEQEEVVHEHR